jgi:hypothetical protein
MPAEDFDGEGQTSTFEPREDGLFSLDKVIERVVAARDNAGQLAGRFFVFSLLFSALAILKITGLGISLTLVGVATEQVQYGLFFFVVAAQFSSALATSRWMDEDALEHQLRSLIAKQYPDNIDPALETFPCNHSWLVFSLDAIYIAQGHLKKRVFLAFVLAVTAIMAAVGIIAPAVLGVIYLIFNETFITEGIWAVQFWTVFVTTVLSLLWAVAYLLFMYLND